jgi:hypothetical protein
VIAFLDAKAPIDVLEGHAPLAQQVKNHLRYLLESDDAIGAVPSIGLSRLRWLEGRIGPLRRNDQIAPGRFDAFFGRPDFCWVELRKAVVEHATTLPTPPQPVHPRCPPGGLLPLSRR